MKKCKSISTFSFFLCITQFVFNRASVRDALFFGERYLKTQPYPLIPHSRKAPLNLSGALNEKFETEVLLSGLFDKSRTWLRTHDDMCLSGRQRWQLLLFLFKRKRRWPVAYIFGYKDWGGMRITVNKHTLIPRDETEILIDHIKNFPRDYLPKTLLDIGTGSGCIALALKNIFSLQKSENIPLAKGELKGDDTKAEPLKITALDISPQSLKVARKNEKKLSCRKSMNTIGRFDPVYSASKKKSEILDHTLTSVSKVQNDESCLKNINWIQSDLLEKISLNASFDIIVANLPYVPTDISVTAEVDREPETAIFSGEDGLIHIRRLANQLREKQIVFKELWLEFLPQQKASIKEIFSDYEVELLGDVTGEVFFAVVKK